MSSTPDDVIYLGAWINWSRGPILGSTLTLERSNGDLVIAFTAFFLTFVATRFWRILCFMFHRLYSTSGPQDALYHQRQAILRNAATAEEAFRLFVMLVWTSRQSRRWFRLALMLLATAFCIATFAITSGFSSRISDSNGAEVLLTGYNCGYLFDPTGSLLDDSYRGEKLENAANYVQQCYSGNGDGPDCGRFVRSHLVGATIDENAACPFSNELCRSAENIRLDTGLIDSHDHLGLNAPNSQRISWRRVFSCGPLVTEGYTSQENTSIGLMTLYHYGDAPGLHLARNYVHKAKNLETLYSDDDSPMVAQHHLVTALSSPLKDGTPSLSVANFLPIEPLSRTDGDIDLIFLSGNGILYLNPSNDSWYRVDPAGWNDGTLYSFDDVVVEEFYRPLEPASTLGCVDQYQFCGNGGCGPLASLRDAVAGAAHLFDTNYTDLAKNRARGENPSRFMYFIHRFFSAHGTTRLLVSHLGPASLQSQRTAISGLQISLAPNQWQLDITRLWNITLARLQASMIDTCQGPTDSAILQEVWYNYTTPELQNMCASQKIRSTAYASLNLFGLCFTYAMGGLIVLVSYLLEPLSSFLYQRQKYAHLEWVTTATLQLQRLAHEELGFGTWSRGAHEMPSTEPDELLGYLDITDPGHPVLRAAPREDLKLTPEKTPSSKDTVEMDQIDDINRAAETPATKQQSEDTTADEIQTRHETNDVSGSPTSSTSHHVPEERPGSINTRETDISANP